MSLDPTLAKDRVLSAYFEEYAALTDLFAGLNAADWKRPSPLPGWDVQAVASHIMGTELMLLGEKSSVKEISAERPHIHNEIGARNELWVESFKGDSGEQMCARWADIVDRRTAVMSAMTDEEWHRPSWTPAGEGTYSRFMRIRVYDCWLHECDIRDALGVLAVEYGAPMNVALDEIATGLGYIVGRKAKAPDGSSVTISLGDPVERVFHVKVDGRAAVVDELPDPKTTLRMPVGTFARLTGGRGDVDPLLADVQVDGDHDLGMQIARNMAFTV
ncbi:uncharacterized protein (TIGR03083 family) [Antricoccus suffuscus]|uniref:Uncharacterized protein (TIGR03083 family) n=1 Tax=Antricoccus suffuscus TaxID=1629062 RepID=A0A2T1A5L4_9ACTN|nr:maleylpyruvate isomerase family mycothiol-dependent enzyme [Antricoccus suffuscus]PRZ43891.1 uncharacterized protein (TIGR03083 family) [Antricoccus suffuscus]